MWLFIVTLARTIWIPDDGLRTETCRSVFNVLMCKFYKFYICAVVGIIIEYVSYILLKSDTILGTRSIKLCSLVHTWLILCLITLGKKITVRETSWTLLNRELNYWVQYWTFLITVIISVHSNLNHPVDTTNWRARCNIWSPGTSAATVKSIRIHLILKSS